MTLWPPGMAIRPIQRWPGEYTKSRQHAPFRATFTDTLALLQRELRMLTAKSVVLQVAIAERYFRVDGNPRADAKASHPGVILAFDSKYGPLSYPCDAFWDWQDNVRAIALAMEALRKVDRYGVTKRGEQYTGWKQLPAGGGAQTSHMTTEQAREVLGRLARWETPPGQTDHLDLVRRAVRDARAFTHPDRNRGHRALWDQVEQAAKVLGVQS